ncbi:SusC/RagA family TonB-linked outer membrane protein [Flavobacterium proteolyticum]|uniref:SusC/RagA family TonB-linked outer membrane protein n=1 Tax=Flavobacterium proteolyticum TaxID=2911683 RepID=A0ABR9WQ44_9FLAO|nr:SusC/RagA family TonB-linked outer membrane protein [Flavobacterium proteolyticum]MBE9575940.1 SusC/RagA family TonB-linked outer membrane protein [Flavobacterium proteolyticum]
MKTLQKKLLLLLLMLPFGLLSQNTLKGVVLDGTNNQPLPGVNVLVTGTTNGTTTDFDGNFTLTNIKKGEKISFSYIGFTDETLIYENQKTITITLKEDQRELKDVVVIGYGTVKKKDATGSVSTINSKDFNKGTVVTAENLLNGKVAGLSINTGGGAPGSGAEIRIRGGSSLLASNDPLIVIDGLPISNSGVAGSTSVLSSINPNDIESFTVLKDASATAIYGSRASNGVILITTKKGSKELTVDYNFQYGSGKKFNKIDVFSSQDYRDLINNIGTANQISMLGNANTDWQEAIYRRTDFVDNNLSLKGNLFKIIPTRVSIGNTYQEGLRLTNNFNRNSFSLSMNPSFFDNYLKLNVNANYTNQKNRFADGVEGAAIRFDPTQPIYDDTNPSGFFEYITGYNSGSPVYANPSIGNPVAQLLQTNDRGVNNRFYGNFQVDYKFHFLPELRAVVNLGYDNNDGSRTVRRSRLARSGFLNNNISLGTDYSESNTRINKSLDSYFIYNKTIGDFDIEGTAGYAYQKFENSGLSGYNATNPTSVQRAYIDNDIVLIGFFGRGNINFKNKYLLTFTYRRDGTSRFGESNRWGNFPAAAFAWKVKEDFFKNSKLISDLKLRLGWGITGQQEIVESLFYRQLYNIGNGNSQYIFGNDPISIAVPSAYGPLKWEETTTYNAGIDFGIADNKLSGSVDLFYKKSNDLFQIGPFADGGNYTNQGPQNVGDMSTKGIELNINYNIIKNENVNWDVNLNATKFERRIDKIAAGIPIYTGFTGVGTGGTSQILAEGYTPNSFYVYKQLYDASGAPIEGAFADLNGDGIITGADRYIYKNPDPDLLLGFSTTFKYKNLDLGFNLRASVGNRILNTIKSTGSYYSQLENGQLQNVSTNVLYTNFQIQNGENVLSDMFIENGSFLRMDYATVGYTFPKWLDGKASVRLFTGVQNPFIITKYSGLDPEINGGIDATIYPRQKQILFGANVKF